MLIFGGTNTTAFNTLGPNGDVAVGGDSTVLGDTWLYSLSVDQWLNVTLPAPVRRGCSEGVARSFASSTRFGRFWYLYGGYAGETIESTLWRLDVGNINLTTGIASTGWECLPITISETVAALQNDSIILRDTSEGALFPAVSTAGSGQNVTMVHCGGSVPRNFIDGQPGRCFYIEVTLMGARILDTLPSIAAKAWQFVASNNAAYDTIESDGHLYTTFFGGALPLEDFTNVFVSATAPTLASGVTYEDTVQSEPLSPLDSSALLLRDSEIGTKSVLLLPGHNSCRRTIPCFVNLWLLQTPFGITPPPDRPRWVLVSTTERLNQPLIGGQSTIFQIPAPGLVAQFVITATTANRVSVWHASLFSRCLSVSLLRRSPRVCSPSGPSVTYTQLGQMGQEQSTGTGFFDTYTMSLVPSDTVSSRWYVFQYGGAISFSEYLDSEIFDSATNASRIMPYNPHTDPPRRAGAVSSVLQVGGRYQVYMTAGFELTALTKFEDMWRADIVDGEVRWTEVARSYEAGTAVRVNPFAMQFVSGPSFYMFGGANGRLIDIGDRTLRLLTMVQFSPYTVIVRGTPDPANSSRVLIQAIQTDVPSAIASSSWTGSSIGSAVFAEPSPTGHSLFVGSMGGFGAEGFEKGTTRSIPALAIGCVQGQNSSDFASVPCSLCPFGFFAEFPALTTTNTVCMACPAHLNTTTIGASDISQCTICADGYCLNGGSCTVSGQLPQCACPANFRGPRCENRSLSDGAVAAAVIGTLVCVGLAVFFVVRWATRPRKYYHIFISYRVASEAGLARRICRALQSREVINGMQVRCYLDQKEIDAGEDWEISFTNGLKTSCLYLPLISEAAIAPIQDVSMFDDKQDNLLLEFERALKMHQEKLIGVLPLLVGSYGGADGANYAKFGSFGVERFPNGPSKTDKSRPVRETMRSLFKFQGIFIPPDNIPAEAVDQVVDYLHTRCWKGGHDCLHLSRFWQGDPVDETRKNQRLSRIGTFAVPAATKGGHLTNRSVKKPFEGGVVKANPAWDNSLTSALLPTDPHTNDTDV